MKCLGEQRWALDIVARVKSGPDIQPDEQSDAALVERARDGDAAAFELLARRHVKMVLGLLRQRIGNEHEAEDLAQETLLSAFRGLAQLDDPERFPAWLYRIALNKAHSARRTVVFQRPIKVEDAATTSDAAAAGDAANRTQAVRQAVAALDEPLRLIVTLRYLEGLNAAEIGQRLNIPHGTVRARLSRAMPLLQEKLRRYL
jgi:RNA polymerase sigma-70 factor (ECF subfamily)